VRFYCSDVLSAERPCCSDLFHYNIGTLQPLQRFDSKRFFDVGAFLEHALPLPIPNREVKVLQSDDTYRASGGESRMCRHQRTVSTKISFFKELIFILDSFNPDFLIVVGWKIRPVKIVTRRQEKNKEVL
jgi:hypothetical protein